LREAFRDHAYIGTAGPINHVVEREGLRILLLDSVVEGEDWGELPPQTMDWFESRLSESPRTPTLVAVHHPPIPFGAPGLDAIGLRNAEAFGRLVEANPQIVAVISGHYHRAFSARWCGTNAVVAPSTAQTMLLNLAAPGGPSFKLEPPAFCLHRWDGALLASHVIQAGDFAGPYPYD
jgi:3',5'-cyclic AMP phosphodiesterase CpdA